MGRQVERVLGLEADTWGSSGSTVFVLLTLYAARVCGQLAVAVEAVGECSGSGQHQCPAQPTTQGRRDTAAGQYSTTTHGTAAARSNDDSHTHSKRDSFEHTLLLPQCSITDQHAPTSSSRRGDGSATHSHTHYRAGKARVGKLCQLLAQRPRHRVRSRQRLCQPVCSIRLTVYRSHRRG